MLSVATAQHAPARPFAGVQPDASGQAGLWLYAGIGRLLALIDGLGEEGEALARQFGFLGFYRAEFARLGPGLSASDWPHRLAAWEHGELPLSRAAAALGLSAQSRLALAVAMLPGEDSRFGTLFAALQAPLGTRAPTIETVGRIVGADSIGDDWKVVAPLVAGGLLELEGGDGPRAERGLVQPPAVRDAAYGMTGTTPLTGATLSPASAAARLDALLHPSALITRLERLAPLIASGKAGLVCLRHMPGSDAAEVAAALARAAGKGLLAVARSTSADQTAVRQAGAVALLAGAGLLLTLEPGPGETSTLPQGLPAALPLFVALGHEGGIDPSRMAKAVTIELPFPDPALRERHWRESLGGRPVDDLALIRDRFQVPGGHIRRFAAAAIAEARLDGRERVDPADVRQAARQVARQELDTLATELDPQGGWGDLIASASTTSMLRELAERIAHREHLPDRLSERPGRGIRALFTGPSGTGKTLAARILAAEIGMLLYRTDLSSIVSKYVGETEKNLHRLLSRAEALDVVLLIDEGDSLLAQRTEVRSSNDRFANLETNYLLQRLEHYEGVILVTTNLPDSIDPAFQRRMDVVVPFIRPAAAERQLIWLLHLPTGAEIDPAVLASIAARCALSGGQIRNAVRHAASRALADGRPLGLDHVRAGIDREYQKAGAVSPLTHDDNAAATGAARLRRFAAALNAGRTCS